MNGTEIYALLADGRTVEIRPAAREDFNAVKTMHEAMSPENVYLRFFSFSRLSAQIEARRVTEPRPGRVALLALCEGTVVGVASYEMAAQDQTTAEIAFAVADDMHHKGVATLLLEHLVSAARNHQIRTFTAQTLDDNTPMLRVFRGAGLPVERHLADGVIQVTIMLPADGAGTALDAYLETVARRERTAAAASMRPMFAPESVAVIGASRRPGTVGRAILDNIRTAGYAGRLYAVNPHARREPGGSGDWVLAVADLPEAPDLAVIAVPVEAVLGAADDCGKLGVKAVVVITSGVGTSASAALLATCRRHGMRLIGPNCFGIAVPGIGLDATFAASHPAPGIAGLVMQSGGLGLAAVDQLSRLGIGISSFASVGNKLDVSSNDMLMWWEQDQITKLAVLYIESFGNPRKFARTARRVGATMPVLTVHAGRSPAGQQAAASHTAAAATPLITREALFEQAGIIATPGFGDLIETTALLATQPVPDGLAVAIISNVGGAGVLAADACTDLGLVVHRPGGVLRHKLRAALPGGSAVNGPVDTTAAVSAGQFRQGLQLLAADEEVDAIIALVLPTGATGDLIGAIRHVAALRQPGPVPVAAVLLNQAESIRILDGSLPCYCYPEAAAAAIARAARYGAWRAEPHGVVPEFDDLEAEAARTIVHEFFTGNGEGWLPPGQTARLLGCYGIPLAQAPITRGTRVIVGVTDDHMFGPLVVFGLSGVAASRAARLSPLTDADADKLIGPIRDSADPADPVALRELLLRVSRLAEDLPQVTDLELNPVIARPDGVYPVDARIKVAPYEAQDPFLRRLR
ncbi:MAG TPA: GNAT family N-acetyltransferase [Streptosporangiaceae bacterium]